MKKLTLSLVLMLSSFSAIAARSNFVACTNDPHEYNIVMEIKNNQVLNYQVNDGSWSGSIQVEASDSSVLMLEWAEFNDTHFGYSIYLSHDLLNNWKAVNWTSGNDSDNYEAVENDEPVLCQLLKSKPQTPAIKAENVLKTLQGF